MSYLGHLCLFAYSSDQHILCCVFGFFFVLCTPLSVSRVFPFLISPSGFFNVYLI
jgi:hypothetical protein